MTVAAFVVAALALLVSIYAAESSRRSAASADVSAKAAQRQADAADAEVAILRAQRDEANALQLAAPAWSLDHLVDDAFVLTNTSGSVARDVCLDVPENVHIQGVAAWPRVPNGAPVYITSMLVTLGAAPGAALGIIWRVDGTEGLLRFDAVIPPRPRRVPPPRRA